MFNAAKLVLSIISFGMEWLRNRHLITAGEDKAWRKARENADRKIAKARAARKSVKPDGMRNDKNNRDRR